MAHKHLLHRLEARDKALRGATAIAGDGTTTSPNRARAIVADGMTNIAAGASAIDIKRGLDRASRVAVKAGIDPTKVVPKPEAPALDAA